MALENSAGRGSVLTHYGTRTTDESYGGEAANGGKIKHAVYKFAYDNLPVGGEDGLTLVVPAGATIVSCHVKATTTLVGGTSYDIGLEQGDGTDIDLDGLFDAATLAEINVGEDASTHGGTNSGVLFGVELLADANLSVVATGTFTAGVVELTLGYLD